jgi:hypothetical protein
MPWYNFLSSLKRAFSRSAEQQPSATATLGVGRGGHPYTRDESTFATYEQAVKCGDRYFAEFRRMPGNFPAEGIHVDDHGRINSVGLPFRLRLEEVKDRRWYLEGLHIRPSQCDLAIADLFLEQNRDYEAAHAADPPNVIRFPA